MMNKHYSLLLIFLLAGCASHKVIIDKEGVDMSKYDQDLAACQAYAEEVPTGEEVGKSAAGGAIVGGAIGAILGGRRGAETLAGVGAVSGAAKGGSHADREKDQVVKNCLRGRGYRVLN